MDTFITLLNLVRMIQGSPHTRGRNCLQLLGHMAACNFMTQNAGLRLHCFQGWFRRTYFSTRVSLEKQITVPLQVKNFLNWCKDLCSICRGIPFIHLAPTVTVTTDVSLLWWGAHLNTFIDGHLRKTSLHINLLELRAIRNTSLQFLL